MPIHRPQVHQEAYTACITASRIEAHPFVSLDWKRMLLFHCNQTKIEYHEQGVLGLMSLEWLPTAGQTWVPKRRESGILFLLSDMISTGYIAQTIRKLRMKWPSWQGFDAIHDGGHAHAYASQLQCPDTKRPWQITYSSAQTLSYLYLYIHVCLPISSS